MMCTPTLSTAFENVKYECEYCRECCGLCCEFRADFLVLLFVGVVKTLFFFIHVLYIL
jgi:hypothetical protein